MKNPLNNELIHRTLWPTVKIPTKGMWLLDQIEICSNNA